MNGPININNLFNEPPNIEKHFRRIVAKVDIPPLYLGLARLYNSIKNKEECAINQR